METRRGTKLPNLCHRVIPVLDSNLTPDVMLTVIATTVLRHTVTCVPRSVALNLKHCHYSSSVLPL